MIGLRGLAAVALACVATSSAACSSSSSTPTKFACAANNTASAQSSACSSCVTSSCDSQASAAFGSGYASGDVGGGACGSYYTCIAKCACGDTSCLSGCTSDLMTGSCESALQTAASCLESHCASSCGTSIGTPGTGSDAGLGTIPADDSGAATGCYDSASGLCIASGLPASDCAGGMSVTKCPSANLAGCCTLSGVESCFYPPISASEAMQTCTAEMGTFSTTP